MLVECDPDDKGQEFWIRARMVEDNFAYDKCVFLPSSSLRVHCEIDSVFMTARICNAKPMPSSYTPRPPAPCLLIMNRSLQRDPACIQIACRTKSISGSLCCILTSGCSSLVGPVPITLLPSQPLQMAPLPFSVIQKSQFQTPTFSPSPSPFPSSARTT